MYKAILNLRYQNNHYKKKNEKNPQDTLMIWKSDVGVQDEG